MNIIKGKMFNFRNDAILCENLQKGTHKKSV